MHRISSVAVILALCWVLTVTADEQPDKPVMVLSEEKWDFGVLEQGQVATKAIHVKNAGTADLLIRFVRSSCAACVGNVPGIAPIPPGQSGKVVLTFYSKGLKGPQNKTVYIHGNDPENPYKTVTIVGTVKAGPRGEIGVAPEQVDVGLVVRGKECVRALTVGNIGKAPLTIKEITGSELCTVTNIPKEPIGPEERAEIKLSLDTAKLKGLIKEVIVIQTDDPITPMKTVIIVGYAVDSSSAPETGNSVTIRPEGDPVKVPGTDTVFFPSYRVANNLSSAISVAIADEKGMCEPDNSKEIIPGEAASFPVPASASGAKGTIPLTIFLPSALPKE